MRGAALVIAVFPVGAAISRLEQQRDGTQGAWSRPRVLARGVVQPGSFFSTVVVGGIWRAEKDMHQYSYIWRSNSPHCPCCSLL